jgi:hypothetical protein
VLSGLSLASPSAADIDGDGRVEIVVGKASGIDGTTLRLYRFQGDAMERLPWQLDTSNNVVRSNAAPVFEDIDGDGDFDLFVGAKNGRFALFENIGSPSNPVFRSTAPPAPFDTLDLNGSAAPQFTDLDGDGDRDVVVGVGRISGSESDSLLFWLRDGDRYAEDELWPSISVASYPAALGLIHNEAAWLFVGTGAGGILAFENHLYKSGVDAASPHGGNEDPTLISSVLMPEGHQLTLPQEVRSRLGNTVVVYGLDGKQASVSVESSSGRLTLDFAGVDAGIYVWRDRDGHAGRILVLR